MGASREVAVVATLDTKGAEAIFLRECLRARGYTVRLVDVSTRGDPSAARGPADETPERVGRAAGASPGEVAAMRRDEAMAAMGRGAGAILAAWAAAGSLRGVIGIGGNQGTAVGGIAMRNLPLGLPKVLVSTVASRDLGPVIGCADVAVVPSVGDLLGGPNRVTRPVLVRAAGLLAGMIEAAAAAGPADGRPRADAPAVALTALGNTHAAVTRVMARLGARGYETVPFHASGSGGPAMESLVEQGMFAGVVDLTPHELLGEVAGDDIYAPARAGRLTAAAAAGIPQVVAPGGLDYFVFGAPDTVPKRYRGRPAHHHNPYNTNVRAAAVELRRVGTELARRLNAARGPAAFFYPLRGWSEIGREGGPLWDPAANEALRAAVRGRLRRGVGYVEIDAAINDPAFADEVGRAACEMLESAARAAPR